MARLVGINHVVLEVSDLDAALDFYGRVFELELRGRVTERLAGTACSPTTRMAFIDMGDQFLVLAEVADPDGPDRERHFGLVVDDREEVRRRLSEAGTEIIAGRGLDFRDPWGNRVQVVEYGDIQFAKTPAVLSGMGLGELEKTSRAIAELRKKGLL